MLTFTRTVLTVALGLAALGAQAAPALASSGLTSRPLIVAGAPPDSPTARIDPNVASSPFSGVVSLNIRFLDPAGSGDQFSFICSGTALNSRWVLTAAHCVDQTGQGNFVNLNAPGTDVRVLLNDEPVFNAARSLIGADSVVVHPDYQGFGVCPFPASFQCVNDDIALVHLSTALPDGFKTYQIAPAVNPGDVFTMVGYGTSGDGINGFTVSPDFFVKRSGKNVYDLFDTNDEAFFDPNTAPEVWYYDFDGSKPDEPFNGPRDSFCLFVGVCGDSLGNDIETNVGGGDSGGPSFVMGANGELLLAANNTFGGTICYSGDTNCQEGGFGDFGGGILLQSYVGWINQHIPTPGSLALAGLALLAGAAARRRRH